MTDINVDYFPTWRRYLELIREGNLCDRALGALYRAMMEYQFEGKLPERLPSEAKIYWLFIQKDLDHARQKYETSVLNGRKGGRKKKKPEETQRSLTEGKTITESIPESESISISESISEKDHGLPAKADGSVCKKIYGEYGWVLLSDEDYDELQGLMGPEQLRRCIAYIDESAQSTGNRNHWLDWKAVLKRCYQKRWHETSASYGKQDIPQGASGELGEAELEAIRRVLAT